MFNLLSTTVIALSRCLARSSDVILGNLDAEDGLKAALLLPTGLKDTCLENRRLTACSVKAFADWLSNGTKINRKRFKTLQLENETKYNCSFKMLYKLLEKS